MRTSDRAALMGRLDKMLDQMLDQYRDDVLAWAQARVYWYAGDSQALRGRAERARRLLMDLLSEVMDEVEALEAREARVERADTALDSPGRQVAP